MGKTKQVEVRFEADSFEDAHAIAKQVGAVLTNVKAKRGEKETGVLAYGTVKLKAA